jgi:hypothetical protein
MFGSFFNSVMYQRYLRAKIKNGYLSKDMFMAVAAQPMLIGILSAMVTADIPEDEEDWVTWGLEKWGSQLAGMYPIIRDIFAFAQGFNKRGVVQGGTSAPTTIVKEVRELASDDGSWDDAAGLLRAVGLVVPLPGGGQVARWFDYAESDDQNFLEGTVEGKQRNE